MKITTMTIPTHNLNPTDEFQLIKHFDDKQTFINYVKNLYVKIIRTNKKVEYLNVASEFDIETSSFYDTDGNKTAIMYCFTIGINGHSYFGRTWDDLNEILDLFIKTFNLNGNRRLIIFIHNLSYEFQFMYKRFNWKRVFSVKTRTPLSALNKDGIEFRCSYLLSGYSLQKVGEHLQKYKVEKKVGDLDYEKIRHSKTPMTKEEIGYVLNDGLVVMAYIQEQIESHGNITRIPSTKTGEVRRYCRKECLYGGRTTHKKKDSVIAYKHYRQIMNATKIQSVKEYIQLKNAFMGGFTHANGLIVGKEIKDVTSFDFTSSYPYVMVSEKFPMLAGRIYQIKSKEDFYHKLNNYCCLMDITLYDVESIIPYEHYISQSHCRDLEDFSLDNGRIVDAKKLSITITEQDYFIMEKCYTWKRFIVNNFRIYPRSYLPTNFVKAILELYKNKTELKDVVGMESEYLHSKELVNACFGMSVTDICRQEIPFNTENNSWEVETTPIDYLKDITKYNNSGNRFLSYAWGIWVTAYARRNLWSGIFEFKQDYLYSDTDSVKVINVDKHRKYIDEYNNNVMKKLSDAMRFHKLPIDYVSPKDINGHVHTLGLWDEEYHLYRFKTLGAKRYMVEYKKDNKHKDHEFSLTISGLNKKNAIPYLLSKNKDIFKEFKEDMYIPPEFTGKQTHTYIDEERIGVVIDYLGNTEEYHEFTCVHLSKADYTLSLARDYVEYLLNITLLEYN